MIFKLNVNNEYKLIETITGTSYNDKDVKEGNTYYYKIKSALSTRTSEFSSVVSGMSGKSEYGYYLRGFIPGWGQFYYNHDTKGCMFLGGFVLSSGFAGYAIYDYFNTKSAYNKVPLFSPRSIICNIFEIQLYRFTLINPVINLYSLFCFHSNPELNDKANL